MATEKIIEEKIMITCSFCGKSFFTYGEDYEDHLPTCFEMREEREQAKKENL